MSSLCSRALLRSGYAPKQRLTVFYGTAREGALLKVFWVITINNRLLLVGTKGRRSTRKWKGKPKVQWGELHVSSRKSNGASLKYNAAEAAARIVNPSSMMP